MVCRLFLHGRLLSMLSWCATHHEHGLASHSMLLQTLLCVRHLG